jgi:hypothetical protein
MSEKNWLAEYECGFINKEEYERRIKGWTDEDIQRVADKLNEIEDRSPDSLCSWKNEISYDSLRKAFAEIIWKNGQYMRISGKVNVEEPSESFPYWKFKSENTYVVVSAFDLASFKIYDGDEE